MKQKITGVSLLVVYILVVVLSSYYLIVPNYKIARNSKNAINTVETEKNNRISEINKTYEDKIKELDVKYENNQNSINDKYTKLEEETEKEYLAKKQELDAKKNNQEELQHKEFRNNGFSKKYYEIENEISKIRDELNSLNTKNFQDKISNKRSKEEELEKLKKDQSNEIRSINKEKETEIKSIDNTLNSEKKNSLKAIIYIVVGSLIILLPLIYLVVIFNKLTRLRNRVKSSWSEVNVYLKERTDLIPNIVEAVKGASTHEEKVLKEVTNARVEVMNSTTRSDEINANEKLDNSISKLFLLQEAYPELKTNTNFINLQNNLQEIEDKIAYSRKKYNHAVLNYQNRIEVFPSNIIAAILHFKPELFFEISKEESENKTIDFN